MKHPLAKTSTPDVRSPEAIAARGRIMDDILTDMEIGMSNLYNRWQDEKEYEDFGEYCKVMTQMVIKHAPAGTVVLKHSKRPFGVVFQIPGFPYQCIVSMSGHSYSCLPVRNPK